MHEEHFIILRLGQLDMTYGTIYTTSLRLFDHSLLPHLNSNFTNDHHNLTTDTNNIQVNFYHNFFPRFNLNFLTK